MPRPRANLFRWMAGGLLTGMLLSLVSFGTAAEGQVAWRVFLAGLLLAFVALVLALSMAVIRGQRLEAERLAAIEEMVTLRHWPAAAAALQELLMSPMHSISARVQALMFLAAVLARYHRFSEAIEVHDHLLGWVDLDEPSALMLRAARAMALLREDRLIDADRAISELRRMPGASTSALVALVELYRDVKTGHHAEAIEIFNRHRDRFGPQLGHRAADAFLLAAVAHFERDDEPAARALFEDATLLAPPIELLRRYPESRRLFERFPPAPAPPEAA
ncbi:MAG: hypothetical protein RMJ35_11920 [Phycisphaerales bacterium]|nr:hypothetical protein [Phycisphaerales bacterium]